MGVYDWIDRETLKGVTALVVGFVLTEQLLKPKEQRMPIRTLVTAATIVGGIRYISELLGAKVVSVVDSQAMASSAPFKAAPRVTSVPDLNPGQWGKGSKLGEIPTL